MRGLFVLFSVAAGLSVANIYYAQPLLDQISLSLGISHAAIGVAITLTQIGYAFGLFFLVPLGDIINRRWLISSHLGLSSIMLLFVATSSNSWVLFGALIGVGLLAVVIQTLVAYAATLSSPEHAGRAVGTVTSGVILGILLSRTAAGVISDAFGWRTVYLFSAACTFLMSLLLFKLLPQRDEKTALPYFELLKSTVMIFLDEPLLRLRASFCFLIFATFSCFWTPLVLPLSAPPFMFSHTQIGLFGLAGAVGALIATKAGRLTDKGLGNETTGLSLFLLILSWILISRLYSSVSVLVIGVILMDLAIQAVHVTNQSMIFKLRPGSQSRIVATYMIFYSFGSGVGAITSTVMYSAFGWTGVCLLGSVFSGFGFLLWLTIPHPQSTSKISEYPVFQNPKPQ